MKKKLAAMLPYLLVLAVDFYLLPFLAEDTGTAMIFMLCVMPLAAFAAAVAYGLRHGFSILLPVAAMVLFAPTVLIHYNATAWGYAPAYGAVVLIGMVLGRIFYGKR